MLGDFQISLIRKDRMRETLTQAGTERVDLEILSRNEIKKKQRHTSSDRDWPQDPRIQMLG